VDYFDYNESTGFDVEEFLEQSQEREKQRLESELEKIERQLEERNQLHEEIVEELESKLDWYIDRLELLYKQNRGKDGSRKDLKAKVEEFYREIRQEKQNAWREKQKLEKERRQLLRDLDELDEIVLDFL
jgi:trichohyalin